MKRYLALILLGVFLISLPLMAYGTSKGQESLHDGEKLTVTRAEFSAMVVNSMGLNLGGFQFVNPPTVTDFYDDVDLGTLHQRDILMVTLHNILSGKDNLFRPDEPVTRQEVANTLINILNHKGIGINPLENEPQQDDISLLFNLGVLPSSWQPGDLKLPASASEIEEMLLILTAVQQAQTAGNNAKGVTYILTPQGGSSYLLELHWGRKPSSGYSIEITNTVVRNGVLYASYITSEPKDGEVYLTVITHPRDAKIIKSDTPVKKVVLVNK